jgi:Ca2+-binding RTX toxin-like protein
MATKYKSTSGNDIFTLSAVDTIDGGAGSDIFKITGRVKDGFVIDGGTNGTVAGATDAVVTPVYYTGTSISTVKSTLSTPNAIDKLVFSKSGNYSNIAFTHIEQIELASGVSIILGNEQLDAAMGSLDLGATNPGLHFYGVAGGKTESVTVMVDYEDFTFTPAATVIGATPTTYNMGDFQLDDASIGYLFHDVLHKDDFFEESTSSSYARADGSNNDDVGYGSRGVDNATLRLGDDTYYGNTGNDLLVGHQGADYLDGGDGDDIFNITGFESGILGSSSKADDGTTEWIATGAKHDVVIGGNGKDTLRITAGADTLVHGTVVLNDDNFKSMEIVEVGTTVGRINVEDGALQLINNHYYLNAGATSAVGTTTKLGQTFDNVKVDASGVSANGLKFVGNGNANTFIGTPNNDIFIGNGGNDTLTGGSGSDTFVFGQVHTQTVTGAATAVQRYKDIASALTGTDTITDFVSGKDKIELHDDFYTALSKLGAVGATNLVIGTSALDADDYLVFDSASRVLSYDADANGIGAAIPIAQLTGVSTLVFTDFTLS